jgi:hypothetical protein
MVLLGADRIHAGAPHGQAKLISVGFDTPSYQHPFLFRGICVNEF